MEKHHKDGKEYLDDTPVSIPSGLRRPPSIHEMIRRYVRSEQFAEKMRAEGKETEEEANDFELEDEEDIIITRHEFAAMAGDEAMRLTAEEKLNKIRDALKEAHKRHGSKQSQSGVDGAGSVGKAGKADGEPKSGNAAGDRKAARGVDESGGEFAEQG